MSPLCDYHDNQVFGGRSQRLQRLRLVGGSLVVECGPPDVELPGPVDGPGSVDVVVLLLGLQGCAEKQGESFRLVFGIIYTLVSSGLFFFVCLFRVKPGLVTPPPSVGSGPAPHPRCLLG